MTAYSRQLATTNAIYSYTNTRDPRVRELTKRTPEVDIADTTRGDRP